MEMNLQKYLAFVKVVEYKSFTKAANSLSYTQSGISRMIHDLEKELGVILLDRGTGGRGNVALTPVGMQLFPHITALCKYFEELQSEIESFNGLETGLLRIGTFSSVASHWIPQIICKFSKDYPQIHYELLSGTYTEIENWISDGRVDIGFIRLPTIPGLGSLFLERDPFMVILPRNHPLADAPSIPITLLEKEPFFLLSRNKNTEIKHLLDFHNIQPDIRLTTYDDYAIMSMVEAGLGISLLPQLILQGTSHDIVIKPLQVPIFRDIGIAFLNKELLPSIAKRFLTYLPYRSAKITMTSGQP